MKLGIMQGADRSAATVDDIVAMAKKVEDAGLDSLWMANIRSLDAISALTVAGVNTARVELGTAVTPIYPRHPAALAQQALTAEQACGGRFTLGIGVSHKVVVEGVLGMSFAKPARYMRDYLGALLPLLRREVTEYKGEIFEVSGLQIDLPDVPPVPTILAALGTVMLKLAGELTEGTNTWMVGSKTIETHITKHLNGAAEAVGRSMPRIIAGFPIVLTTKVTKAREKLEKGLEIYGQLPSYRAMLDREGVDSPADLALIGDEDALRTNLLSIESSGVTDFNAAIMDIEPGAFERTFDFVASLKS